MPPKSARILDPNRPLTVSRIALQHARQLTNMIEASDAEVTSALVAMLDGVERERLVLDMNRDCAPTEIVPLSFDGERAKRYAVVRERQVVTILDESKARDNIKSGAWREVDTPFAALADASPSAPKLEVVRERKPLDELPLPDMTYSYKAFDRKDRKELPMSPIAPPTIRVTPERDEFEVAIPLDLAALGVRSMEAELEFAKATAEVERCAMASHEAAMLERAAREACELAQVACDDAYKAMVDAAKKFHP